MKRKSGRLLLATSGIAVGALLGLLAVAAFRFVFAELPPAKKPAFKSAIVAEPKKP